MRIATLGISHETNTFSRVPAEYDKFVEVELLRGAEIIERHGDSNYTIAGYLEVRPYGTDRHHHQRRIRQDLR
jgi:microcystin degradation protein MlrC